MDCSSFGGGGGAVCIESAEARGNIADILGVHHYNRVNDLDILRPLQKGLFLPPALFANAHLLLNKLRFAA